MEQKRSFIIFKPESFSFCIAQAFSLLFYFLQHFSAKIAVFYRHGGDVLKLNISADWEGVCRPGWCFFWVCCCCSVVWQMDCQGNPITPMCLALFNARVGCLANERLWRFGGRISCYLLIIILICLITLRWTKSSKRGMKIMTMTISQLSWSTLILLGSPEDVISNQLRN